ncbi:MAG: hypothetical protein ACM3U2_17080, partial [Deltaproteobacteria bacterium]
MIEARRGPRHFLLTKRYHVSTRAVKCVDSIQTLLGHPQHAGKFTTLVVNPFFIQRFLRRTAPRHPATTLLPERFSSTV